MQTFEDFDWQQINHDWHAEQTISLGELIEGGFNPFGDDDWSTADWFDADQRKRIEKKFVRHYKYWELGILPPLVWRDYITERTLLIAPKYKVFYQALKDGANISYSTDEYYKHRNVFSDFPATQLNPSKEDYASTANDDQYERIMYNDFMEKLKNVMSYNDIDYMWLKEYESFFNEIGVPAQW